MSLALAATPDEEKGADEFLLYKPLCPELALYAHEKALPDRRNSEIKLNKVQGAMLT